MKKSEVKIISEGKRKRECVEIIVENGKKTSRTFHQRKTADKWLDSVDIPPSKRCGGK